MAVLDRILPYAQRRDVLAPTELAALRAFVIARSGDLSEARLLGGAIVPDQRDTLQLRGFGETPLAVTLAERIATLTPGIFAELGVEPFEPSLEMDLLVYRDGQHFCRHLDTSTGELRMRLHRIVSIVYYFQPGDAAFTGGELRLFPIAPGATAFADISPVPNTLVAFLSYVPHEVLRVSCPSNRIDDSRMAINIWLRRSLDQAPDDCAAAPAQS